MVNDEKILEKCYKILNKNKRLFKKELDNEPLYNDKYINTKMKCHSGRVYTNFQNNKIPKNVEYFTCLSVISLDSIFVNSDKEYYLQIFSEECKYKIRN